VTHVLHQHPFTPYDRLPTVDVASFKAMPITDEMMPVAMADEFRHRVGTKPLDVANWLPSDSETAPTIEMKRELLANRRDEVVSLFEGGENAAQEAAELVAQFAGVTLRSTGIEALVEASLLVADDLTVVEPRIGGDSVERMLCVAGVVCAPSRWKLASKMGQDMMGVHQPVARYAGDIGAAVDTRMAHISVDRPVWRSNWTIEDHPALFQPFGPPSPLVTDPALLWVRMERQTLRRLPKCDGILFTIRGYQQPITDYVARGAEQAKILHSLVARLPDDVARYKSVLQYRDLLLPWLAQHF